jgi:asparagine synthase (glutamine-hydrolysing)
MQQICDVLVSGLVGDCLWGSDRAFGPVSRSALASSITARYEPYLHSALPFLHRDLAGNAQDLVTRGIAESVDVIEPDAGRRDLSTYWNLQNRQRRWGYMLGSAVRRRGLAFEAPFLDRRVLEFARSMSDDQRHRGRLHALIQREVFAGTARIPRGNDGNPPYKLPSLYVSDDESLVRQTLSLGLQSPIAAARRFVKYSQVRSAREMSRRLHWQGPQDLVTTRRSVFQPTLWIRSGGTYRRRTMELLEEALGDVPDFLDRSAIQGSLDACRASHEVDPHMTARAVSLCLWAGYWRRVAGGTR